MKLSFFVPSIFALLLLVFSSQNASAQLDFLNSERTYQEASSDHVQYRNGTVVKVLPSFIRIIDTEHEIEYARTVRSLRALSQVEFPGLFEFEKLSGKVLVAALGGTDDSLILELRALGLDAYGTDIFLYPNQKKSEFLFQADLRDTNLTANQFDAILMSWGPLTYTDSERESVMEDVLAEMGRILKPRGTLYVAPLNLDILGPIADRSEVFSYKVRRIKAQNPFEQLPTHVAFTKRTNFSRNLRTCLKILTSGKND